MRELRLLLWLASSAIASTLTASGVLAEPGPVTETKIPAAAPLPGRGITTPPTSDRTLTSTEEAPPAPTVSARVPTRLRPDDIVGRWGLAGYFRDEDRARTEILAGNQCSEPYVIHRSNAGVMMHNHDAPHPENM